MSLYSFFLRHVVITLIFTISICNFCSAQDSSTEFPLSPVTHDMPYSHFQSFADSFPTKFQPYMNGRFGNSPVREFVTVSSYNTLRSRLMLDKISSYAYFGVLRIFYGINPNNKMQLVYLLDTAKYDRTSESKDTTWFKFSKNDPKLFVDEDILLITDGKGGFQNTNTAAYARTFTDKYSSNATVNGLVNGGNFHPVVFSENNLSSDLKGVTFSLQEIDSFINAYDLKPKDTIFINNIAELEVSPVVKYKHSIAFTSSYGVVAANLGCMCPPRCGDIYSLKINNRNVLQEKDIRPNKNNKLFFDWLKTHKIRRLK